MIALQHKNATDWNVRNYEKKQAKDVPEIHSLHRIEE